MKNKKLVFFGSGTIAEKELHLKPDFIVDNNPDLIGTQFHHLKIKHPDTINGKSHKYEVVVCTTSVLEVKSQLESYGYNWNRDAYASKYLEENLLILEMEERYFSFLISSGLPSNVKDSGGGGVYQVTEIGSEFPEIKKIYSGNIHGLINADDGYAFTSQGEGIILLNKDLEVSSLVQIPDETRPHGIQRFKDLWVYVSSYNDSLCAVTDEGKTEFEYSISNKKNLYGSAQHHCNDLCIIDNFAYVSMFSISGNWKRGIYDGGVMQVDLLTGQMQTILHNLTMPHNISYWDDGLKILNSFKGEILSTNFEKKFTLPGFVRGYDEDKEYYFVGESKNRNFSRLEVGRSLVSIDSRISIISKKINCYRSLPLPRKISEVHSIIKLS